MSIFTTGQPWRRHHTGTPTDLDWSPCDSWVVPVYQTTPETSAFTGPQDDHRRWFLDAVVGPSEYDPDDPKTPGVVAFKASLIAAALNVAVETLLPSLFDIPVNTSK